MQNPTIRALSGAPATAVITPKQTALVMIDFQLEYFQGGNLVIPDGPAAVSAAARLTEWADLHNIPVFHVQHLGSAGALLFAKDSPRAAFHPDVTPKPFHAVVPKTTASSFASTDLHQQLQQKEIDTLIICGLMTHMCVSTTVRDARPLGYRVLAAGDACATRDIDGWDGGVVRHADLHRATLTALSDSFAEVLTTETIMALPVQTDSALLTT